MTRVMLYGDSILNIGAPTDVGTLLQAQRPDLQVLNASFGGLTTAGAIANFAANFAAYNPRPAIVVTNLGVNDPVGMGETDPLASATRILRLVTMIRASGAEEVVLTPTPAPFSYNGVDIRKFTRDIRTHLFRLGTGIKVFDVRDEFLTLGWDNYTTIADNTHPNAAGRQLIANFISGLIP